MRQREDAYTGKSIQPDLSRYDGVCSIVDRNPATLPAPVSIAAIEKAMEAYVQAAGIDTEDEVRNSAYHLIHGIADYLFRCGVDFDVVLMEAIHKAGSGLRQDSDAISRMSFARGTSADWSADAGKRAAETYANLTGRENGFDEDDVAEHMIHALAALARRDGFDLVAILSSVSEDRTDERLQSVAPVPGF